MTGGAPVSTGGPVDQPPSLLTARAVLAALAARGVRDVVISPGSRSAPFAVVLAAAHDAGDLRARVVLDERSAGFIALGMARAALADDERRPAAVVTTSGTAVANLHPAVLEADAAGVPLVVISADRPHELVGTGANQTTEQTGIFGRALRAVIDLPADLPRDLGREAAAAAICGQVRRAVEAACGGLGNDPGPVQINARLRPPLAPLAGPEVWGRVDRPVGAAGSRPATAARTDSAPARNRFAVDSGRGAAARAGGGRAQRGLIVAGDAVDGIGQDARGLAELLGWPLLAEPTSGARGGPMALTRYAELLSTDAGRALAEQAEHVVVVGHPSLTRPVGALLARADLRIDIVASTARWTDVAGTASRIVARSAVPGAGGVRELADLLGLGRAPRGWALSWRRAVEQLPPVARMLELSAEAAAVAVWEETLGPQSDPPDPRRGGPVRPRLVLGSSLAVRHMDRLAPPVAAAATRPAANRGLAGIDGTLATAVGLHLASGDPVRAVVGDLTFLHDAMSLGRGRAETGPDVQVVVLDDAGGGIFSTLEYPHATGPGTFARFFTTAQTADIPGLARALGARVDRPGTLAQLRELLARPVSGLSLIHVEVEEGRDDLAGRNNR